MENYEDNLCQENPDTYQQLFQPNRQHLVEPNLTDFSMVLATKIISIKK